MSRVLAVGLGVALLVACGRRERRVPVASVDDLPYGDLPEQTLDVYGDAAFASAPVVIYVHGGGWATGTKENVGAKADWALAQGWILVSVDYRLSGRTAPNGVQHPAHVDDVATAIAFVADNAETWGGDPARIGLLGHSAGAHLVALAATEPGRLEGRGGDPSALQCVFANDTEALDIPRAMQTASGSQESIYTNAFGTDPDVWEAASPQTWLRAGLPPFLLTRRGAPPRQAIVDGFVERANEVGVAVTVIDAGGLSHSDVNRKLGESDDTVLTPVAERFFRECLAAP